MVVSATALVSGTVVVSATVVTSIAVDVSVSDVVKVMSTAVVVAEVETVVVVSDKTSVEVSNTVVAVSDVATEVAVTSSEAKRNYMINDHLKNGPYRLYLPELLGLQGPARAESAMNKPMAKKRALERIVEYFHKRLTKVSCERNAKKYEKEKDVKAWYLNSQRY